MPLNIISIWVIFSWICSIEKRILTVLDKQKIIEVIDEAFSGKIYLLPSPSSGNAAAVKSLNCQNFGERFEELGIKPAQSHDRLIEEYTNFTNSLNEQIPIKAGRLETVSHEIEMALAQIEELKSKLVESENTLQTKINYSVAQIQKVAGVNIHHDPLKEDDDIISEMLDNDCMLLLDETELQELRDKAKQATKEANEAIMNANKAKKNVQDMIIQRCVDSNTRTTQKYYQEKEELDQKLAEAYQKMSGLGESKKEIEREVKLLHSELEISMDQPRKWLCPYFDTLFKKKTASKASIELALAFPVSFAAAYIRGTSRKGTLLDGKFIILELCGFLLIVIILSYTPCSFSLFSIKTKNKNEFLHEFRMYLFAV